jgi:hypothetical protein
VQQRAARDAEPIVDTLWNCMANCDRGEIEQFLQYVHQVFSAPLAEGNGQPRRRPSQRKAKK